MSYFCFERLSQFDIELFSSRTKMCKKQVEKRKEKAEEKFLKNASRSDFGKLVSSYNVTYETDNRENTFEDKIKSAIGIQ